MHERTPIEAVTDGRLAKDCGPRRRRLDDLRVNIANFVRRAGGGGRVITLAAGGVLAISGIAVAISLASCEASSTHAASKPTSRHAPSMAHGDLPSIPRLDAPAPIAGEPEMRVRILTAVEGVKVGATGGVLIGQGDPKGSIALPAGAKAEKKGGPSGVSIALKGGQWLVCDIAAGAATINHPSCITYSAATSLVLLPSGGAGQFLAVNSGIYPGAIRLTARTDLRDGVFDAVEFVGIEEYLPGVVAKEMLTGWPLAAYQAQSVAARTYALQERERACNAGLGYDVECSDRDQVYAGMTSNTPAREAVRATRGVVLKDGERLLRTYFSSTCGGRTAAAKDTWPTGPGFEYNLAGPIQEHHRDSACVASPLYRWTVERPRAELVKRFRLFGERNGFAVKKLNDIQAIEAMAYNSDGRPSRYRIVEPGGAWYQLSAEELRIACNTSASGGSMASAKAPAAYGPVAAGATSAESSSVNLLAASIPAQGLLAAERPPTQAVPDITRQTRINSGDFEVSVRGDRVIFTGRGFGHGVGLCQYCAKAFAERGEDWRTMIERFYPGARIVTLY
jgi:stage II sporulation protein D